MYTSSYMTVRHTLVPKKLSHEPIRPDDQTSISTKPRPLETLLKND